MTELVKFTIDHSDYIIFPSEWAKSKIEFASDNSSIIYNAPLEIFHRYKKNNDIGEKIKLVTHHWSTNPKKGFAYYKELDNFIGNNPRFEFTYVGRKPDELEFKNTTYIPATGDNDFLAKLLSDSDIYITASEEEAGANHVLEALAAGLPIAYHKNGGSINDYCESYGKEYDSIKSLFEAVEEISKKYKIFKETALSYKQNIEDVMKQYMEIINGFKN